MTTCCPHCGRAIQEIDIEFNASNGLLRCGDKATVLRAREIDVLEILLDGYPRAVAHEAMVTALGPTRQHNKDGDALMSVGTLGQHVAAIRKKLMDAKFPLAVVTVNDGVLRGYMLVPSKVKLVSAAA